MRTHEQALRVALKASKKDQEKSFYVVRVLDDDLYGPFAVCDDYELDGYFCGVQEQDILNVCRAGREED